MAIIYPDIDSVGWGDDVNANFRELNQNDTDIKATIGTEEMGTTVTTLKGAIKEVKGIADNNTTQLNARMKNIFSITKDITGKKVKIIGDSITAGDGSTDYSLTGDIIFDNFRMNIGEKCWAGQFKIYFESNFNCIVKNYAIPGIQSQFVVDNLSKLISTSDDIIVCMIGTNDRSNTDYLSRLTANLKSIYNYVKLINKEIIFVSPPPSISSEENQSKYYCKNNMIDNIYLNVCSDLNIEYISCYKLLQQFLLNTNGNLSGILNSDGQHPNDTGHIIIFRLILNALGFSDRFELDTIYDTNWINLTNLNTNDFIIRDGHEPQIRKIGNKVYIRGYVVKKTEGTKFLCTIPSGFLPSRQKETWQKTNIGIEFGISVSDTIAVGNGYTAENVINNYICLSNINGWLVD